LGNYCDTEKLQNGGFTQHSVIISRIGNNDSISLSSDFWSATLVPDTIHGSYIGYTSDGDPHYEASFSIGDNTVTMNAEYYNNCTGQQTYWLVCHYIFQGIKE